MRIFKHYLFSDRAESEKIKDESLLKAVDEIENGLFEANLGSNLYKKRIARTGKGKSSGYRTLIVFKKKEKAFFVYGFGKNVKQSISTKDEEIYRKLSKKLLDADHKTIKNLLMIGELFEIKNEKKFN